MRSPCLILIPISLILIGILYWLDRTTINEPYANLGNDLHTRGQTATIDYLESSDNVTLLDTINIAAYDPYILANDKTIYTKEKNTFEVLDGDYTINDIATDIMNETDSGIDWSHVYVDDSSSKVLGVIPTPNTSINNFYGRNNVLSSHFKEDICEKYSGDSSKINKKCQELSTENCKLLDCCVLLNGTKCIAGNINGPTFLTDNGLSIDQNYFYYKETCYGNCEKADSYAKACGEYTPNSTGISKECMIQMFNNYGCSNPSPDALINDNMVKEYRKTTKQYVDNYIKTAVDVIYDTNTDESLALCNGS